VRRIQKFIRKHLKLFTITSALLTTSTVVLAVFWLYTGKGEYEPVIFILSTLAAAVGVPTLKELISHSDSEQVDSSSLHRDFPQIPQTPGDMSVEIEKSIKSENFYISQLCRKKLQTAQMKQHTWDLRSASETYSEVIAFCQNNNLGSLESLAHSHLALVYTYQGNILKSHEHLNLVERGLDISGDWIDYASARFNQGLCYRFIEDYDKSKLVFEEARAFAATKCKEADIGYFDLLCEMDIAFMKMATPYLKDDGAVSLDKIINSLAKMDHTLAALSACFKRAVFYLLENRTADAKSFIKKGIGAYLESEKKKGLSDTLSDDDLLSAQPNWKGNLLLLDGAILFLERDKLVENTLKQAYITFEGISFVQPLRATASLLYSFYMRSNRRLEAHKITDGYQADVLRRFPQVDARYQDLIKLPLKQNQAVSVANLFLPM
jgi:tetratricopeptide (TPR) repeat protein